MYETSFPLWTTVQLFSDKYSYILLHYWQVDKTKDFLINPQIHQTGVQGYRDLTFRVKSTEQMLWQAAKG